MFFFIVLVPSCFDDTGYVQTELCVASKDEPQ